MFHLYYTAAIMGFMTLFLAREWLKPPVVVSGALLLMVIGGIVSIDDALAGFSNKGMITVGLLFVISAALQASGLYEKFIYKLLGDRETSSMLRYVKLLFPVAGLSAFLNNTPIVASMIPIIKNWSKKHGISASKLLIPLSYAAILGGTCTLIGTSTNLIVHGMLLENNMPGLGFFEITKIGVPVTLVALTFLALFGNRLLPDYGDMTQQLGDNTREFVSELKVTDDYPHIGKTVHNASLRHLNGLFLFQIERKGDIITPVRPDQVIEKNDRLFFTGLTETIYELQKTPGLQIVSDQEFDIHNLDSDKVKTYEAVISGQSPLIGLSVRDSEFRKRYNGVILAIHRSGQRINKKVGDIVFQPSDTVFVLARKGFYDRWYHSPDFYLVSSSVEIFEKPAWKGNTALGLLLAMILAAAMKIVPIILAAAVTVMLMILLRIINVQQAKKAINWGVMLMIACSFGIAKGLQNSGLAVLLGNWITDTLGIFGGPGIIAGLFAATAMFTWVITNNAVAAIMFPVAFSVIQASGLDPRAVTLTLAVAASTCFATPIGYQTNMMVHSTGGYRFLDFVKVGLPLSILVGTATTVMISVFYL